jgi:hypothetical protein
MMFGVDEKLTCITNVELKSPQGQELCLAYKTTTRSFLAPVYVKDDGYVLGVRGHTDKYYEMPPPAELAQLQDEGLLPRPLPAYSLTPTQLVLGHALWVILAFVAVGGLVKTRLRRKRHATLHASEAPVSTDPPILRTDYDRWLAAEVQKYLDPGERIEQQAYGYARETSDFSEKVAYWVALTDRRLVVIEARVGAFRPLRENIKMLQCPRSDIRAVVADERHLRFVFANGTELDFFAELSERRLSNQLRFVRDMPRLF